MDAKDKLHRDEIYSQYVKKILPRFNDQIEADKEEFKNLCRQYITSDRKNSLDKIFMYLEKTDFFTAPSSTVFHLNCPGGLCKHSINVFKTALSMCENILHKDFDEGNSTIQHKVPVESIAIAALFHDLCKIGMYYPIDKWTKDGMKWISYLGWGIDDTLPIGHAEKSLYRLSRLIELQPDEILAIRWHMGAWGINMNSLEEVRNYDTAGIKYPLVEIIHSADSLASKILETSPADDED